MASELAKRLEQDIPGIACAVCAAHDQRLIDQTGQQFDSRCVTRVVFSADRFYRVDVPPPREHRQSREEPPLDRGSKS